MVRLCTAPTYWNKVVGIVIPFLCNYVLGVTNFTANVIRALGAGPNRAKLAALGLQDWIKVYVIFDSLGGGEWKG